MTGSWRAALAASAMLGALTLAACDAKPVDPCQVNPTRTDAAGQWVEADGEQLDLDPCDADDLDGDGKHKVSTKKPNKPTPKKTSGSTSRRFG